MRAVVQRVLQAAVSIGDESVGQVNAGLCVFVGVGQGDDEAAARTLAEKLTNLRVFEDEEGKMNRSVLDVGGSLLLVSQFTLFGDVRKGRRPSFASAMEPVRAATLFETVVSECRSRGVPVETGRFRAEMRVSLVNDGPVTILIDTERAF
jgi:D-tyrosyl-tRNA(Tyr) deacylase